MVHTAFLLFVCILPFLLSFLLAAPRQAAPLALAVVLVPAAAPIVVNSFAALFITLVLIPFFRQEPALQSSRN